MVANEPNQRDTVSNQVDESEIITANTSAVSGPETASGITSTGRPVPERTGDSDRTGEPDPAADAPGTIENVGETFIPLGASIWKSTKLELWSLMLAGLTAIIIGGVGIATGEVILAVLMIPVVIASVIGFWLVAGVARLQRSPWQ